MPARRGSPARRRSSRPRAGKSERRVRTPISLRCRFGQWPPSRLTASALSSTGSSLRAKRSSTAARHGAWASPESSAATGAVVESGGRPAVRQRRSHRLARRRGHRPASPIPARCGRRPSLELGQRCVEQGLRLWIVGSVISTSVCGAAGSASYSSRRMLVAPGGCAVGSPGTRRCGCRPRRSISRCTCSRAARCCGAS